jgi:polysaccharide chain length determinant protein (PEP-CTERM system associated)
MINPNKPFNIHDYIEIFLRRIWYIIIPLIVVMLGAILYAYTTPKLYRATTLILITPQKVPEAFVRPIVTSTIGERLQSIGQEIMSRTRLEQVISELRLYQEEVRSAGLEAIVESMRKNIQVEIKGREGYFTISYIGKDPMVVTVVTNKLASLFIEENLRLREAQAQGTSEFLAIELKTTEARLEEQERMVTKFKRQFMGELPEQRDANLRVLEQLQLQYQRTADNLRAVQDRKLIIQKQLADIELMVASETSRREDAPSPSPSAPFTPIPRDPQIVQLEQLRNQLKDLQSKYTDKHPDILIVKKRIAELEVMIEKRSEEKKESSTPESAPPPVGRETRKERSGLSNLPRYTELESQLMAADMEIRRLREEEAKVKSQISLYRERIENTPMRELAMAQMTRDYQNTKELYQSLLKKREEALQAENLERRQKGEQFKVVDPAKVPEKPFKPDIQKILLFGILLGSGLGFGLAFVREQMDRSFRDAEDLEATLGLKVIANIPKIEKKAA